MTRTFRPFRPLRSLLVGLALLSPGSGALAQTTPVPTMMNFQGRLARPDGTPVADSSNYQLTFRIFPGATGGTALWTQTMSNVSVHNGVFSVLLGGGNALTDTVLNGTPYLEIQVGSNTPLSPRQAFVSVAFAVKANTVPDGAITSAKLATDSNSLKKVSGGALNAAGGNIGIGTTNPIGALDIYGAINFQGNPNLKIDAPGTALRLTGQSLIFSSGGPNSGALLTIGGTGADDGKIYMETFSNDFTQNASELNITGRFAGPMPKFNIASEITTFSNKVGIGTTAPTARLHVIGNAYIETGFGGTPLITLAIGDTDTGFNWVGDGMLDICANNVSTIQVRPNSVNVSGTLAATELQATGSDVAEPYHIAAMGGVTPVPGMVVVIDPAAPGHLKVARRAYDATVAGIVSGANGVKPGLVLRQPGTLADGNLPVASSGRVYCWCDADANGPIAPGNLLTTSNTPGHAMRATDRQKRDGAVIGKAMTPLKQGKGLVLVLVTLQ